ncbi:MAG: Gfo/Idh/MocA family protein [Verrucomicrobiota bacterium]
MSKEVRVGVIGYGNMGTGVARMFADNVEGASVAAVCDIDPERLQKAKEKFGEGTKYFEDADAMIASGEVDGIYVATPHYEHPRLAIKGLENNLHVLVEKPAGVYTKQVREMNEAAAKSDRVFGLMFNQRTRPVHKKFRDLVESGELGEVQRTNWIITTWFRSQAYYDSGGWRASWRGEGGGVLLNQCPHNLDLWQWIAGMPARIRSFASFGKYHDIEVEDEVTAYAEYENGATGLFITTTGEAPGTNRFEVIGDRGKVVMENGKLTFWRTRQSVSEFCKTTKGSFGNPETWECSVPAAGHGDEHTGICRNWTAAIRDGKDLLAPGEEGIRSLQISNAMLLSAWKNDWVDIPVDEDEYKAELDKRIETSRYEKKVVKKGAEDLSGSFA